MLKTLLYRLGALLCMLVIAGTYAASLLPLQPDWAALWQRWLPHAPRQLLSLLWPLLLWPLARWLKQRNRHGWLLPLYALLAAGGAWYLRGTLTPNPFARWDLASLAYLAAVAGAVWRMAPGCRLRGWRQWSAATLPLIAGLCLLPHLHERLGDILYSLRHPLSHGELWPVNWLAHRARLVWQGWQGNFSGIEPPLRGSIPYDSPLVWIAEALHPLAALLVLAAAVGLILLLRRGRPAGRVRALLLTALVLQTALGSVSELLLCTATDLGLPLLRNPLDAPVLLYLLCSPIHPHNRKENPYVTDPHLLPARTAAPAEGDFPVAGRQNADLAGQGIHAEAPLPHLHHPHLRQPRRHSRQGGQSGGMQRTPGLLGTDVQRYALHHGQRG